MTWKLEKLLSILPYDHLDISEEVGEQVELGHIRDFITIILEFPWVNFLVPFAFLGGVGENTIETSH